MSLVFDVQQVTYERDNRQLLSNINWQVRRGEHWAILGLNGSGKTTLLNLLTGYIWPTKGKITVLGHEYGTIDLRELRKSIGWVSSAMVELLNTSERTQHVVVSGKFASFGLHQTISSGDLQFAAELMQQLGIHHLLDRVYEACSQGEKQKVLIARALMASPRILILDEPCSGLDVFSREQLLASIETLIKTPDAPTIIYVTHHVEEIIPAVSNTLLLRCGQVFKAGSNNHILTSASLTDFYQCAVEVERRDNRTWLRVPHTVSQQSPF